MNPTVSVTTKSAGCRPPHRARALDQPCGRLKGLEEAVPGRPASAAQGI